MRLRRYRVPIELKPKKEDNHGTATKRTAKNHERRSAKADKGCYRMPRQFRIHAVLAKSQHESHRYFSSL